MEIGTLYITTQGARLTKTGERLIARNIEGKVIQDIPFFRLRQIICFGTVEVTASTIFQLMRRGIDLVYLTLSGRFKCRLSNLNQKSVKCRLLQYRHAFENSFRLKVAKNIVKGKLGNCLNMMRFRQRRGGTSCANEVAAVSEAIDLIEEANTVDEVMGLEGAGSRAYFSAFSGFLKQNIGFNGRNRRPPKDPVNAMLSFGYTILFHKVLGAVERAGLDPFIANLHAARDGRPSLALDLMEEFRLFVVDAAVLRMVNLAQVKPDDFLFTAEQGVKMKESVIALLVKELQARLTIRNYYLVEKRKLQVQDQILSQAMKYKSLLKGEEENYLPVIYRW
jgi:CRISPR-associated protein Cas1